MEIPDIGEIVTPVDDPYQYNPAWRSVLAGYLFSVWRFRGKDDFDSIAETGCVNVSVAERRRIMAQKKRKGRKPGGQAQESAQAPAEDPVKHPHVDGAETQVSHDGKEESCSGNGQGRKDDAVPKPIPPFDSDERYRKLANDRWVISQVMMFNDNVDGKPLSSASVPFRLAQRWYTEPDTEAALKKRLEAMLLTEIGLDVVALDMFGELAARPAVEAYEKMYFNCRDEKFEISKSTHLVNRMAMPYGPLKAFLHKWEHMDEEGFCIEDGRPIAKDSDVWKAVAATMGYEPLIYLWRWDRVAHGIKDRSLEHLIEIGWKASASRMLSDLFTGEVSHEDAARVLSAFTAQAKKITDDRNGRASGDDTDTTKALMSVLYATSPKMVAFSDDDASSMNSDIQSRIASQLAINKQSIEDKGKAVEAEVVDAQIAASVSGAQ